MSDAEPNGPRFHLVDVFATERYAGNQLAVVESRGRLADDEMAAVAAEFDFSETTFVESLDPDPTVRIFTPEGEIPFAGHPTLGTAAVVRSLTGTSGTTTLDLGVGPVPVRPRDGALWMTQAEPTFGPEPDPAALADVLGLPDDAVAGPPQVVSTGLPTVVVPLVSRAALTDVALDRDAYDALVDACGAKNVLAFCRDPRDPANDIAARVFAPAHGVPEDPATGSSNGCLAAHLARREGTVAARVEQGHEMGRPSRLGIEAETDGDGVTVRVGGRVVPVGRGRLHRPDQGI
ncbi:MAG: phenazine biosynthesis protein PhzF family [uncultured archaeon A07HB70]|jgi:phenazine biosynthesis protein PhzF family|nr:MAG: phenazine biosynthesis protein PhzF family [uncultured archaeon A07HB70]